MVYILQIASSSSWGWRGPLLVHHQKIPDCLIKTIFLGEAETAVRSGIISRFGIMSFKHKRRHFVSVIFLFNGLT